MSRPTLDLRHAQAALLEIADDLARVDRRLRAVAEAIEPTGLLAAELRGVAHCVRTDLLCDAVETLTALGHQSTDGVLRRHAAIDSAARMTVSGASWTEAGASRRC